MTEQTIIPPSAQDHVGQMDFVYGAFMDRLIALIIDQILLYIAKFTLLLPLFAASVVGSAVVGPTIAAAGAATPSFWALSLVLDWVYFAACESSARGATIGKRAMRLQVLDENGQRLRFGRASLRYFGKIVSYIPLMLGFIMALFTKRKQALHDLMAGTIVVSR